MTESRVEAVARAMDAALREIGNRPIVGGRNQGKHANTVRALAQAAIEASDAWLKADRRAKDKAVLKAEYPTTPRRPDK